MKKEKNMNAFPGGVPAPDGMPKGMPKDAPGMPGPNGMPKLTELPGLGKPPEVFLRYSRVSGKPGARRGPGGGPGRRGMGMPGGKLDKGTLMRLIREVILPNWAPLLIVFAAIIISAQCNVRANLFLRTVIDDYITPVVDKGAKADFAGLLKTVVTMGLIYLSGITCTWLYNWLMAGISQGSLKKLRLRLFRHMQELPIRFFDTHAFGDTMSRYTNDTETLRHLIGMAIPNLFSSLVTVITVLVNMIMLNLYLTAFTLVIAAFMLWITKKIATRSSRYFVAQQATLGAMNAFIEETVNGQKVVKVFNHEEIAKDEFEQLNEALYIQAREANKLGNMMGPLMGNIGNLQYILLAIAGGALAIHNVSGLTLGSLIAFLSLSRSFSMPINQISQQVNTIISAMAGAQRIFRMMDEPAEEDNGYVTLVNARENADGTLSETTEHTGFWAWKHPHKEEGTVTYEKLMGDVTMQEVDFAYEEGKPVLHDISLYARPGQKVAFVGATGAGKTTITNLINRFYDIADGKIRYDGININKIRKPDLRRSLGIVLQDTNLFTGTVAENIRYGKLDATDEEVEHAAKLANAYDFIVRLPQGFDTMLTANGGNLSQGQRQLIAIARAAVADPPVMILDEATSSIDTRTELLVQRGMDELMKGRTTFVIAHRLSTVMNSDVIMVLDHGRIIERGTHEQLIEQKGQYYQLYTGAFELE